MSTTGPDEDRSQALTAGVRVPFLKRVKIRNFKSIVSCDVELGPFTVLIGRNGAGKSNFLDALNFVADALTRTLERAIESRGGIHGVCSRSDPNPKHFEIEMECVTRLGLCGNYGFGVRAKGVHGFEVEWERCRVRNGSRVLSRFRRDHEKIYSVFRLNDENDISEFYENNLFLQIAHMFGGLPYGQVQSVFEEMSFYNLNPRVMIDPGTRNAGEHLRRDGGNVAGVFGRIERERPEVKKRIIEYLSAIVPGITDIRRASLGPYETLEFEQTSPGAAAASVFYPLSMSDGTLRAFGALVAVAQLADGDNPASLVGIEEPEAALHPAAAGALMDALHEAATHTQVVVTTHSPDLLDRVDLETDRILVVEYRDGQTQIGPIDRASREAIKEHLYSPGELLRMDQLQADWDDLERQRRSEPPEPADGPG